MGGLIQTVDVAQSMRIIVRSGQRQRASLSKSKGVRLAEVVLKRPELRVSRANEKFTLLNPADGGAAEPHLTGSKI